MVLALGSETPSQGFQNRDWPDLSKAVRLPLLAQNITPADWTTVPVEMRGFNLRSVMPAMSSAEKRNTFSEYAIRRRRMLGLPFLKTFPFQFGYLFDEALHLAIIANGLAHMLPPCRWDAELAQFAGMTLHQVHGLVPFAGGAMAVGFAALAGTIRNSAAKKPLAGDPLGNAGAEVAFGCGELGSVEGLGHVL